MELNSRFSKAWYYALAIQSLAGTIIGVGMLGLPYVALEAGFFITLFYLLFFGCVIGLTHLCYAEVTLRTKTPHRFTGYVGEYFGLTWKHITLLQGLISLWGSLLIYTIVGAKFLYISLTPFLSSFGWHITESEVGVIFFLIVSSVVWRGDLTVGRQEFFFTLPMIFLIILIFVKAITSPYFSSDILFPSHFGNWVLPYGITLFALSGFSAVPMLEHILAPARKRGMRFRYSFIVFSGTLIPAFLYILFTWGVFGVSGFLTTKDALSGLAGSLGPGIVTLGAVLALLAIYTSFISVGEELEKTFSEDYGVSRLKSFILTMFIPLGLYLLNVRDFIGIIEFVGAIMGGYVGVMVILLLWRTERRTTSLSSLAISLPKPVGFFIIAIFVFASLYAIFDIVSPYFNTAIPS